VLILLLGAEAEGDKDNVGAVADASVIQGGFTDAPHLSWRPRLLTLVDAPSVNSGTTVGFYNGLNCGDRPL
jgi:hypothetical protein